MSKSKFKIFNGYIEGYYGKLLNWAQRKRILTQLNKFSFSNYFYCPKEDVNHRFDWRLIYGKNWRRSFQNFCKSANNYDINVIVGISPGVDYQFANDEDDFNFLMNKAKQLIEDGADNITLMFDDIPNDFYNIYSDNLKEGTTHARLANLMFENLKRPILVIPRIYADELIEDSLDYLTDFCNELNPMIPIFYCGKNIVSDHLIVNKLGILPALTKNNIIFWDNIYANDYCPRKIFLGPLKNRNFSLNIMFNLTGMIETDLFLIAIYGNSKTNNNFLEVWLKVLKIFKIPNEFLKVESFFTPLNNLNSKLNLNSFILLEQIIALDHLLWSWKTPLAREWYPFLFGLKHDLQFLNNDLSKNRIKKVFPIPLNNIIIKNNWRE